MGAKADVREGKVGKIYGAITPVSITAELPRATRGQRLGSERVNRVDLEWGDKSADGGFIQAKRGALYAGSRI